MKCEREKKKKKKREVILRFFSWVIGKWIVVLNKERTEWNKLRKILGICIWIDEFCNVYCYLSSDFF